VSIYDCHETGDNSFYRIEAVNAHDASIHDYLVLKKPLIINLRYLVYYLQEALEFVMKDSEFKYMHINTLEVDCM
jgi:hypothetical protein